MISTTLNKSIKQKFDYEFEIKEDGLYAVFIKTSGILTIEIDRTGFFEIATGRKNLELKKTTAFLSFFNLGKHIISLIPKDSAFVESIAVKKIDDFPKAKFDIQDTAENGDRRSWYTFVLINLSLKSISAEATARWRLRDSDDVKLIIDNKIQKNNLSVFYRDWLWAGSIFKKLVQKETQIKTIETNLSSDLHFIEFWADRTPTLNWVELNLGGSENKRIPTVDNPKWTGNFRDDPEEILLARLIFGEARNQSKEAKAAVGWSVRHRVEMEVFGGNTYHAVILKSNQYTSFNTTDGNYKYIIDPLHKNNPIDEKSWRESYEIAGKVIKGEIEDFSGGANFFHDNSLSKKNFLKRVPGARFIKRIGSLLFYFNEN